MSTSMVFGAAAVPSNGDQAHTSDIGEQVCSEVAVEKGDASRFHTKYDVMAESLIALQSIQDLLENEIQKLEVIARSSFSLSDSHCTGSTFAEDSVSHGQASKGTSMFNKLFAEEKEEICLQPPAVQVNKLHAQANILKSKLEEATSAIQIKEDQITELESVLNEKGELQEASVIISEPLQEKQIELEMELENLFKQKIEFEVEYLFVLGTTQKLPLTVEDQISLIRAQKALAGEQIQMMHKLKEAEHKAEILKGHAEELETSCEQLVTTKEMLKMQKRLCVRTLYFIAQILLLLVVYLIYVLRPQTSDFVPT